MGRLRRRAQRGCTSWHFSPTSLFCTVIQNLLCLTGILWMQKRWDTGTTVLFAGHTLTNGFAGFSFLVVHNKNKKLVHVGEMYKRVHRDTVLQFQSRHVSLIPYTWTQVHWLWLSQQTTTSGEIGETNISTCIMNLIRDTSDKTTPSPSLHSSLTHTHRSIGYRNKHQSPSESGRRNVLGCVTVFDTNFVSSTPSPLPPPFHTTFPRSTVSVSIRVCERFRSP